MSAPGRPTALPARMRLQRARPPPKLSVGASTLNNNYGGYVVLHHPASSTSPHYQQHLGDYAARNSQINPASLARAAGGGYGLDPYSRPVTAEDLRARLMIAQQEQRKVSPMRQRQLGINEESSDSARSLSGDCSPPPPAPPLPRCCQGEADEEQEEMSRLRQRQMSRSVYFATSEPLGETMTAIAKRRQLASSIPHPRSSVVERSASALSDYEPEDDYYTTGAAVIGTPFRLTATSSSPALASRQRAYPEGREKRYEEARREARRHSAAVSLRGQMVPRPPARPPVMRRAAGGGWRAAPLRREPKRTVESSDNEELSSDLGEREPGDGEEEEKEFRTRGASAFERPQDDEEDDGIDEDVDEDVVDCLDDDDGDGSLLSSSTGSRATSRMTVQSEDTGEGPVRPALMRSNFSFRPPVVRFVPPGERVEPLAWEYRKLLKWRLSTITPLVVKHCVQRSGFRISKKSYDWIGYFGKHMKSPGFRSIREYQKINHFPGTFQIGRKDRLWRNLYKMQVQHGKKEYNFFPQTFCLPSDMKQLKRVWEDGGTKQKWIVKPPACARGIGVRVVHKWSQIPKKRPVIVQRYLYKPLLINGSKFDLRVYVYVTSFDPLRIYVHEDGLVRFASQKYSASTKNLSNRFMHLTNYSVNKKNTDYKSNSDDTVRQGHKWSLKLLWPYLREHFNVDPDEIWSSIKDVVVKTIISAESLINSMIKIYVRRRHSVHELFGFDILLDEAFKPWILECNISPSLHSDSKLDINIKGHMIADMLCLAGYEIPEKNDLVQAQMTMPSDWSRYEPSSPMVTDKRLWDPMLSPDERGKHAFFCQRAHDELVQQTIFDCVTPDDLRILTESVDEWGRAGGFQRAFPCPHPNDTARYLRFMSQPRYYNLLLQAFLTRFHSSRSLRETKAIDFLECSCLQRLHLQAPTTDPDHQWSTPSYLTSARGDLSVPHPGSASTSNAGVNGHRRTQLKYDHKATMSQRRGVKGRPLKVVEYLDSTPITMLSKRYRRSVSSAASKVAGPAGPTLGALKSRPLPRRRYPDDIPRQPGPWARNQRRLQKRRELMEEETEEEKEEGESP